MNLLLFGGKGDGGLAAAERALSINADLADAHAVRARILFEGEHLDEANAEIETALRLDPESWEVNRQAAMLNFRRQRLVEAIRYFEKASALMENDFGSPGMLITAYTAIGDHQSARRAAQMTHSRCERVIAQDRNNGSAMAFGADALAVLGDAERAKEWMNRALLVDPENNLMRYNFACTLAANLKDRDAALEMLGSVIPRFARGMLNHAKIDPDLESLRDDPRYKSMIEAAEVRLAAEEAAANSRP
jgi:adenylate cyclase